MVFHGYLQSEDSPDIRNVTGVYLTKVSAARNFLCYVFSLCTSVNIDTVHCDSRQRVCLTVTLVYVVHPKVPYIIIS